MDHLTHLCVSRIYHAVSWASKKELLVIFANKYHMKDDQPTELSQQIFKHKTID